MPAGDARIGNIDYDVLMNSSPDTVKEFNQMPLKVVNGMTVLLGDVAFVHDGYAVQTNIVRVNGRRATYLSILRKAGASTLAVVDAVRDLVARHQSVGAAGDGRQHRLRPVDLRARRHQGRLARSRHRRRRSSRS